MEAGLELARAILFVKHMGPMVSFYRETLGLKLVPGEATENWVEFAAGPATFALHAIPAEIAAGILIADPPQAREETPIKLVFRVEDVAAERARLLALGVPMHELRPWGACDGVDPEGNVFQLSPR